MVITYYLMGLVIIASNELHLKKLMILGIVKDILILFLWVLRVDS